MKINLKADDNNKTHIELKKCLQHISHPKEIIRKFSGILRFKLILIQIILDSDLHEVVVDQVDDFQMSWQNSANHISRPPLQGLGQDRVVGVSTATLCDVPSL